MRRGLGAASVVVAGAALVTSFAVPYRRSTQAPRPPVLALLGRLDGGARLTRLVEADGTITWQSVTTVSLPATVVGGLPSAVGSALGTRLGPAGRRDFEQRAHLTRATVYRDHVVERVADGTVNLRSTISMVDEQGFALLASIDGDGSATAYDPPLQILPRDPHRGATWTSTGKIGSSATFRYRAKVVADRRRSPGLGRPVRCIQVRATLHVERSDGPYDQTSREWFCAGLGSASYVSDVPNGQQRARLVGIDGRGNTSPPPAPAPASPLGRPKLGEGTWKRTGVAASLSGTVTARPSMLPAVIDAQGTQGGLVLATEASPVLQALRADPGEASVRSWSAAMGDVAYGAPLIDQEHGRVFAGAADGEVRAFTTDGLFLWSADVGDNVATRPALADDLLVVGSEDGHVVGLDAGNGRVRWRVGTKGPVVSWPAVIGNRVVVGSDDGVVRSIDPRRGRVVWTADLGTPIEAPIGVVGSDALVLGRDGTAVRLGADGSQRWSVATGVAFRTEPVVVHGQVLAVGDGELLALDLRDGSERWRRTGGWVGPVAPISGRAAVIAARDDGTLLALDRSGSTVERWKPLADVGGLGSVPGMTVGPVVGAGAVWVVDASGRVQRLGPPLAGAAEERAPSWAVSITNPALGGSLLQASPLVDAGRAYLLGADGQILRLDAGSGEVDHTGTIDLDGRAVKLAAVAGDGRGFVSAQTEVISFALPDGRVRWRADLPGSAVRPPVLTGGRLLVASEDEGHHHLSAYDAADGRLLWDRAAGDAPVPGAMFNPTVVAGDVVVTGDPARAYRVDDGSLVWTAAAATGVLGSGALLPTGEVALTVTDAVDPTDDAVSSVVALDPDSGEVRHRIDLPGILAEGFVDLVPVDGDLVVLDAGRTRLVRIDPLSGEAPVWTATLPAARLGGAARLGDGRIWLGLTDGRVLALDARTGDVAVRTSDLGVDLSSAGLAQTPVEVDGTVVATGGLLALGIPIGAP